MSLSFISNKDFKIHTLYWIGFILFFTIIWGTYDHSYYRNFMVQICSLPARLILVYGTLLYLFPKFFTKRKYLKFLLCFVVLLLMAAICIQRSVMLFFVQGRYLPHKSEHFFKISELMNTLLDVNLALIIPFSYTLYSYWYKTQKKAERLEIENQRLARDKSEEFIYLKKGKALQKVLLSDIIFVESLKNYVRIKTKEKEITSYRSISAMEELLPEDGFLRVHRSFIVSIAHISSFSPTQIDLGGIVIPIGRKFKEDVKEKLGYY